MLNDHILWCEKYRPKTVQECILPEDLKKLFQSYVDKGEIPNLLLSGSAGVGKTTIARALCEEVGCDYIIINGSDEGRSIDVLRNTIRNYASSVSLSGGRKVIIIDEADFLNANTVQPALRGAIEEFAANTSFIFTCNYKNKILEPIHSRCAVIDFKVNGNRAKLANQFFKRVEVILSEEKVKYSKKVVAELITKYFPDNRRILNELQRHSSSGNIDVGSLGNQIDSEMSGLITAMKDKDFTGCRKWVVQNSTEDQSNILRKLYDSLFESLQPQSIPQMVLIIARYSYQGAFVSDPEINLLACITEILSDCNFR